MKSYKLSFRILLGLLWFIGAACMPTTAEKGSTVEIVTDNIFSAATMEIVGGGDLGLFLVGEEAVEITLKITNSSSYSLENMHLNIPAQEPSTGIKFNVDQTTGKKLYPGGGGTCSKKLKKNSSCTIVLYYSPVKTGEFEQPLIFSYNNLVSREQIEDKLTFRAGEAAALILTSEVSNYDFGTVERTLPEQKTQQIEIENVGGLPAKITSIEENASTTPSAYTLLENTCPESIDKGVKCTMTVGYEWYNSGPSDSEQQYDLNLKINYEKDPKGSMGALNTYYSSLSTAIEGLFEARGVVDVSFTEITVGNTNVNTFKIVNNGWYKGVPKKWIFNKSDDTHLATCKKAAPTDTNLTCYNEAEDTILGLDSFPFEVKDNLDCMDKEVAGIAAAVPGSCLFDITFHPSVLWLDNANNPDYNGIKMLLNWDSRWKDQEQLYTEQMFTMSAAYKAAAKLEIKQIEFASESPITSGMGSGTPDVYQQDFGRRAMILSTTYQTPIKFQIRNKGYSKATDIEVRDGRGTLLTLTPQTLGYGGPKKWWRDAYTDCGQLNEAEFCTVFMQWAPLSPFDNDAKNEMWDDCPAGTGACSWKQFIITYKDGASVDDDDSPWATQTIELRLTATPVAKGFLVYNSRPANDGRLGATAVGSLQEHQIILRNAGTGSIPYISPHSVRNLIDNVDVNPDIMYKLIPKAPTIANKDCYPIIDWSDSIDTTPANICVGAIGADNTECTNNGGSWISYVETYNASNPGDEQTAKQQWDDLGSDETCSLTVQYNTLQHNVRTSYTLPFSRSFHVAYNGTLDSWYIEDHGYGSPGPGPDQKLRLFYYDGDGSDPGRELDYYGTEAQMDPNDYEVGIFFRELAALTVTQPQPLSSALVYRQEINLPQILDPADGITELVAAATIAADTWPYSANTSNTTYAIANHGDDSWTVASALVSDTHTYNIYYGQFPENTTIPVSFSLRNFGGLNAQIQDIQLNNVTGSGFTLTGGHTGLPATLASNSGAGTTGRTISANFNSGDVSGLTDFDAVVDYQHDDGLNVITKKVRLIAQAIDTPDLPDFTLKYKPWSVVFVDPGVNETAPTDVYNTGTTVTTKWLAAPGTGDILGMTAIKGSPVYQKFRFAMKNTSGQTINNMSVYLKASPTSDNSASNISVINKDNMTDCNGTWNPNDECVFDIRWAPTSGTVTTYTRYIAFDFELASGVHLVKYARMTFTPLDPAELSVYSVADEIVNIPGVGNRDSYPVNFGSFASPSHIKVTSYPTVSDPINRVIQNSSTVKASFFKEWEDHTGLDYTTQFPAGAWIEIYDRNGMVVTANRYCFYGDDESNGGVPIDQKGFSSAAVDDCEMNVVYYADERYIGENITAEDESIIQLEFYNDNRSSTDWLYMHISGFIEPNFVTMGNPVDNITADQFGNITIDWDTMIPANADWGGVTGYRVAWGETPTQLNNVHTAITPNVEVSNATFSFDQPGFLNGKYYYLKVMALRDKNGKTYRSELNPKVQTRVVVPPVDTIYDHDTQLLIDTKYVSGLFEGRTGTLSACTARTYALTVNGVPGAYAKKAISSDAWAVIVSDLANNSDYPSAADPRGFNHWLSDSATNVAPIMNPYGYNTAVTSKWYETPNLFYQKTCGDVSCDVLPKMVGGNGVDLPFNVTAYIEDESLPGFVRCMYEIP